MPTIDRVALKNQLRADEGKRLFPYLDTAGKVSCGVGRNLTDRGISDADAERWLDEDVNVALEDLDRHLPWWRQLPELVQLGLANMCFNLGWPKLVKFVNMIEALHVNDYVKAAAEVERSEWWTEVGPRAKRIQTLFLRSSTTDTLTS